MRRGAAIAAATVLAAGSACTPATWSPAAPARTASTAATASADADTAVCFSAGVDIAPEAVRPVGESAPGTPSPTPTETCRPSTEGVYMMCAYSYPPSDHDAPQPPECEQTPDERRRGHEVAQQFIRNMQASAAATAHGHK